MAAGPPPTGCAPSPVEAVPPATGVWWGLTAADRWLLGVCGVVAAVLLTTSIAVRARWGVPMVEISSLRPREYHYALEINSATWVEWLQLPGIGETLARRIVADREERGPFRSIDDVNRVRGIGPKVLAGLKPYLRMTETTPPANLPH